MQLVAGPVASLLTFVPQLQKDMGPWSPGRRIGQINHAVDRLLFKEIQRRRIDQETTGDDIVSQLIAVTDDTGTHLSDQEIRDQLNTVLIAGDDTTATAMAWCLYWIHRDPEIREKLVLELASAPSPTDFQSLNRLPYLNAVCNEALRLYPVVVTTFPRMVEKPIELMGYGLNAGDQIVGCIYLLHHREEIYPQSYQFRPERFLEREFSSYEFIPFGGGARRCIGSNLALFEMKIVIATLLAEFDLALVHDRPAVPQRRGVTVAMRGEIEMRYQGRLNCFPP